MVERVAEMADAMVLHLERLAARPTGPGRPAAARHTPFPHPCTTAVCVAAHPTGSSPPQQREARRSCRASGCAPSPALLRGQNSMRRARPGRARTWRRAVRAEGFRTS